MRELGSLKGAIYNPRQITDEKLEMLKKSLEEFGDLSGFVWNRRTGNLVGGHQRQKVMPENSKIKIEKEFESPTPIGTCAMGSVEYLGEEYAYREVDWPIEKEMAANVAANQHGGEFDSQKLAPLLLKLDEINFDMGLTGFTMPELENIMAPFRDMPDGKTDEEKESEREREYEALNFERDGSGNHFKIHHGDCLTGLQTIPDCSIDSIVTDPPAGISFMGKDWDSDKGGRKQWIAWMTDVMKECRRVLKPGGHALVWSIPRTSHWTNSAIEDAGFEVRDIVTHLFGQGFPKSLDVSKAIDKSKGAERDVVGVRHDGASSYLHTDKINDGRSPEAIANLQNRQRVEITTPATDLAKQWEGYGTALKPACEFWTLARKPLDGTVAHNVEKWGVGGLNIDGCRIDLKPGETTHGSGVSQSSDPNTGFGDMGTKRVGVPNIQSTSGRFPANLILDEVAAGMLDDQSGTLVTGGNKYEDSYREGHMFKGGSPDSHRPGDSGGASRFFYVAKPSVSERNAGLGESFKEEFKPTMNDGIGAREHDPNDPNDPMAYSKNFHPTVKPIRLMRYLIRLVTPPKGTVLDPFSGSGTTAIGAIAEGMNFVGFEQDEKFVEIAKGRITSAFSEVKNA